MARTIVTMEQTYVTAAFFRHLTVDRHRQRVAALYDEGHQQLVSGTQLQMHGSAASASSGSLQAGQGWARLFGTAWSPA